MVFFSEYNQVRMDPNDILKTTLTIFWGNFAYQRIPFGLKNEGENFQLDIDFSFTNIKDHFIVIYLDDLTVYSGKD